MTIPFEIAKITISIRNVARQEMVENIVHQRMSCCYSQQTSDMDCVVNQGGVFLLPFVIVLEE